MTVPAQVSVYAQVFVPRDYDVFAGLDVDHHSIAATFTDHDRLMRSLRLLATHLAARPGDPALITNVRQIAGFLGLVSSEHSTGEKQNRGSITRAGDSRLRNKLIQSAWVTIRKDAELRAFYRRIYERHPKQVAARKAIVAVARKLTTRIYAVLKEQRPFVLRPDCSTAPLTAEETGGPRDRLDG
jgi:hypothetical protein